jgi:choline dehydrogenase-like flavoprotein
MIDIHGRHEVVVIGGGQAGLALGYHLARQGRCFTILEAESEPASSWRRRWDSLKLFTPARYCSLPGLPFPRRSRQLPQPWIDVPDVFGPDGQLEHRRGVTASPGLYFLGLTWQHTRGSALLGWVKDDAEYIAGRIAAQPPMIAEPARRAA